MADSRYRITERVASGGMAEVFRGVAESLQGFRKNIALKRILPALTKNKKFVAMFLDEARLSLSLQHANVVQVFDIGHSEDTYFIVMEYVDGVDLKTLIDWRRRLGRRVPIAQTLYIILEMCKGLAYAHEMVNPETGRPLGIVHRDVSPPNVLISKQGEVKVVDFGLAKASSQLETTDPGVVKGKMSYLSPEAARGEEVDSRADIFSVGILMYELLTGKRLFYGESDYQTVELVRNARIPPIKAQNPEVEHELEDIARKALAKHKEDRFQTATDLQDALAHFSYSRGLKVIARDIADLVRQCLEDRAAESDGKRRGGNIVDTLLQDEINKFTSVDFEDPGARPLSDEDVSSGNVDTEFVDPRGWAGETSHPNPPGKRPTGSLPTTGGGLGRGLPPPGGRGGGAARLSSELPGVFGDARPTIRDAGAVGSPAGEEFGGGRMARSTSSDADGLFGSSSAGVEESPEESPDGLGQNHPTRPQQTLEGMAKPRVWAGFLGPKLSSIPASQRTLLIGMAISIVVLGAVVTALIVRRSGGLGSERLRDAPVAEIVRQAPPLSPPPTSPLPLPLLVVAFASASW